MPPRWPETITGSRLGRGRRSRRRRRRRDWLHHHGKRGAARDGSGSVPGVDHHLIGPRRRRELIAVRTVPGHIEAIPVVEQLLYGSSVLIDEVDAPVQEFWGVRLYPV